MIVCAKTRVWTTKGWLPPAQVSAGDTIISYNKERNCTEYDTVKEIRQDFTMRKELLGVRSKSAFLFVTPDHPLLIVKDGLQFIQIRDHLLSTGKMMMARPFEPYKETAPMEDVRWCGRYVALFNKNQYIPQIDLVRSITKDMSGHEAQAWLEEYFRWNILMQGVNWMKSSMLRNKITRDMILEIGARAGVGAAWWATEKRRYRTIRITTLDDINLNYTHYGSKEYRGFLFDMKTNNNNFLIERRRGSFLVASGMGG